MASPQKLQKVALELIRKIVDGLAGVLADEEHLADMGFGLRVHLEAIGVATLFLASGLGIRVRPG